MTLSIKCEEHREVLALHRQNTLLNTELQQLLKKQPFKPTVVSTSNINCEENRIFILYYKDDTQLYNLKKKANLKMRYNHPPPPPSQLLFHHLLALLLSTKHIQIIIHNKPRNIHSH